MSYLKNLAKSILRIESSGLTKVRFAKTIYFVHKGLAQESISKVEDLKFIRMPLGPVPVGFRDLEYDPDITVRISTDASLVYNMQTYGLSSSYNLVYQSYDKQIEGLLRNLKAFSTSDLVDISHREPSWINLSNGAEYYISSQDLRNPLPRIKGKGVNTEIDEQRLQAKLVEGMLDEIVAESTSLEYPDK